jgi:hypothetical protein
LTPRSRSHVIPEIKTLWGPGAEPNVHFPFFNRAWPIGPRLKLLPERHPSLPLRVSISASAPAISRGHDPSLAPFHELNQVPHVLIWPAGPKALHRLPNI